MIVFDDFALVLEKLSEISSRNEMSHVVGDFLREVSPEEAQIVTYLIMGDVGPSFYRERFALANKQLFKILVLYLGQNFDQSVINFFEQRFSDSGDLGQALYDSLLCQGNGGLKGVTQLSLLDVFTQLKQITVIEGVGSLDEKKQAVEKLLVQLKPLAQKYLIRIVVGSLRLGISASGLIEAFSYSETGNKELKLLLEKCYNVCPDLGMLIYRLKKYGVDSLQNILPKFGVPVVPAAAERVSCVSELLTKVEKFVLQPKLDGLRIQVHKFAVDGVSKVKFFSRNLLDVTDMFPEIAASFLQMSLTDFIVEGEVISYDQVSDKNLNFQVTSQRRRKYNIEETATISPVRIFLFDILHQQDCSLLDESYYRRREILVESFATSPSNIIVISEVTIDSSLTMIDDAKTLIEDYFTSSITQGFEGIIVKKFDGKYQAGKRGFSWIKIKQLGSSRLSDTIDAVVVGIYKGLGKRANYGVGALLLALWNEDEACYQSIAKVGSGLSDEQLQRLSLVFADLVVNQKPENYCIKKTLEADLWVEPKIIIEVDADEITLSPNHSAALNAFALNKGLALRFPRVKKIRTDKSLSQATSIKELIDVAKALGLSFS